MPCCLKALSFVPELKICFFHKRGFVLGEVHLFYYFALSAPHCCVSSSKAFRFTSLPKRIYRSKFLSVPTFGLYCHHHTVITISGQVFHKSRREKKMLPTDIPRHLNLIYRIAHAKAAFPLSDQGFHKQQDFQPGKI